MIRRRVGCVTCHLFSSATLITEVPAEAPYRDEKITDTWECNNEKYVHSRYIVNDHIQYSLSLIPLPQLMPKLKGVVSLGHKLGSWPFLDRIASRLTKGLDLEIINHSVA